MRSAEQRDARELLLEAFVAGWQAALAARITHPRVLAVVESCFEQWLREAADEVDVLGLRFRGRDGLPRPSKGANAFEGATRSDRIPAPRRDGGQSLRQPAELA